MPCNYTCIFYVPSTLSINNMKTHPTKIFMRSTKIILRLHMTQIQGKLIMTETWWIKILGSYRTIKLWMLPKIIMLQKIKYDELAGLWVVRR